MGRPKAGGTRGVGARDDDGRDGAHVAVEDVAWDGEGAASATV